MDMNVLQALIVKGKGPDKIALETDMPDPRKISAHLVVSFTVAQGTGEEYVKENLPGVYYEVLDQS